MKYAFMVTLDWSTDDGADVERELYENYREAEVRFKKLIEDEKNPKLSWVGSDAFDEHGNLNDGYELDYCFSDTDGARQYWEVAESGNYIFHTLISLQQIKIK